MVAIWYKIASFCQMRIPIADLFCSFKLQAILCHLVYFGGFNRMPKIRQAIDGY